MILGIIMLAIAVLTGCGGSQGTSSSSASSGAAKSSATATVGKDVTLINAGKLDVKVAISAEKGIVENNGTVTVSDNGSIVTKTEVKAKLGEPKAIETVSGNEIWKYDINSIDAKAGSAMTLANALGSDTKKAQKIVTLQFEGDAVKSYDLVDGSLTN